MDITFSLGIPIPSYLGIAALTLSAAFFDLRTRHIPNYLVVAGAVSGVLINVIQFGPAGALPSLLGLLTGFALFLPGYLLRMTGGGDLKLMAAIGTFLGAKLTFFAFFLYIFAALAWALSYSLFCSIFRGAAPPFSRYWAMFRTFIATGKFSYVKPKPNEFMGQRLPMAPAIAIGALTTPFLFS